MNEHEERIRKAVENLTGDFVDRQTGIKYTIGRSDLEHGLPNFISEVPPEFTIDWRGREIQLTPAEKESWRIAANLRNRAEAQRVIDNAEGWARAKAGAEMSPHDRPTRWGMNTHKQDEVPTEPIVWVILIGAGLFCAVMLGLGFVAFLHSAGLIAL